MRAKDYCGHIKAVTKVGTEITLVSYFGNVTSALFTLAKVRNLRLNDPKQNKLTKVIPKQDAWV